MQARPRLMVLYGQFVFRYRNFEFPLVLVALLLIFPPGVLAGVWELATDLTGLFIAGLGQALHWAVLGAVRIKRGGLNKHVYADRLVVDGCFAHCRNPLYVGNILILSGLFILYANAWAFAVAAVFFAVSYRAMIAAEEMFLSQEFGEEYRAYCQQVPRWLPNIRGLSRTIGSQTLNWRQAISKTYCSAYIWLSAAVLLLGYKAWFARDLGLEPKSVGLAVAFVLLTALFFLVRVFRKAGLLDREVLVFSAEATSALRRDARDAGKRLPGPAEDVGVR